LGCLGTSRVCQRQTPQLRKGSQILRICFWRGAEQPRRRATEGGQAPGPERESAEPRKARFFAEQKMRPKIILGYEKGSILWKKINAKRNDYAARLPCFEKRCILAFLRS
jgi:hypothetical protein